MNANVTNTPTRQPFEPPAYPYDRLAPVAELARSKWSSVFDLSIGTPVDPPTEAVLAALCQSSDRVRAYPPSIGTPELREAYCRWFDTRLGVKVDPDALAMTVGTKEFVAGLPLLLALRDPSRDTVLYPEMSYPTYEMGAVLAGLRAVPVALDRNFRLDLASIDPSDVDRALCLWVNSPGNPTGCLDDLEAVAAWGRRTGTLVVSDECYVEFTWAGPTKCPGLRRGDTILRYGSEGVLAVHSLSKRSNLAGVRVGCYAGDPTIVAYLREIRKHQGLMVPGPAQDAAIVALADQQEADVQAERYAERLEMLRDAVSNLGVDVRQPEGAFYLWCNADGHDGWSLAELLANRLGIVSSPGEFYGAAAAMYVRVAAVTSSQNCEEILRRSLTLPVPTSQQS